MIEKYVNMLKAQFKYLCSTEDNKQGKTNYQNLINGMLMSFYEIDHIFNNFNSN